MTTVRVSGGGVLHFPPFGAIADSVGVIEPPAPDALPAIAARVHPTELLLFAKRLVQATRKRQRNPRWEKVNRSRLELARLCLDRALDALPDPEEDARDAGPATKRNLVGEAFHTFGEDAARSLADELGVDFDACGEAIERLERRPS